MCFKVWGWRNNWGVNWAPQCRRAPAMSSIRRGSENVCDARTLTAPITGNLHCGTRFTHREHVRLWPRSQNRRGPAEETRADRRGCGENGLHGDLERSFFTPPWNSLETNFQLSFFFFFRHLSISFHTTSYTLLAQTCSWHFGFNGQIEKIKRWPEGSHLILASDVWI